MAMNFKNNMIAISGIVGFIAAILVGTGEFLLHFDSLGRFGEEGGYLFMQGISTERSTTGHFLGVLAAPLYLIGFWHLMNMLEPANRIASRIAFIVMSYGTIVGAVWIGSRASISAIINYEDLPHLSPLASLYVIRYENLLQVTRISVVAFSAIFIWLVLTGRSCYPRWMAVLNPAFLILVSFAIWTLAPDIGIYLMPIALNVAFAMLFLISIYHSNKINR